MVCCCLLRGEGERERERERSWKKGGIRRRRRKVYERKQQECICAFLLCIINSMGQVEKEGRWGRWGRWVGGAVTLTPEVT